MKYALMLLIVYSDRWVIELIITNWYNNLASIIAMIIFSRLYFFFAKCVIYDNITVNWNNTRLFRVNCERILLITPVCKTVLC